MKASGYRSIFKGYYHHFCKIHPLSEVVHYCLVHSHWMLHRHSRSSKLLRGGIGIHNENHSQGEILYLKIAGTFRPRPPPPPLSALAQPGFRSHPLPRSPSSIASAEPAPFPHPPETPRDPSPCPHGGSCSPALCLTQLPTPRQGHYRQLPL